MVRLSHIYSNAHFSSIFEKKNNIKSILNM